MTINPQSHTPHDSMCAMDHSAHVHVVSILLNNSRSYELQSSLLLLLLPAEHWHWKLWTAREMRAGCRRAVELWGQNISHGFEKWSDPLPSDPSSSDSSDSDRNMSGRWSSPATPGRACATSSTVGTLLWLWGKWFLWEKSSELMANRHYFRLSWLESTGNWSGGFLSFQA